ncbi:MAG: hypothetical protein K1X64_13085 [Myxococcaceae bacterium]|nr:hypothetical protein [Myxococcaceae bacterium]
MSDTYEITYTFAFDNGDKRTFTIHLDRHTLADVGPLSDAPPEWTALDFAKCPNCPLSSQQVSCCPAAVRLAEVVKVFAQTVSYEKANVEVKVPERTYSKQTSAQSGLSSLIGMQMAVCGCPVTAKLRPLVRLHLPFASGEETIFRAVGMYLLGQYLEAHAGGTPDWSLKGLAELYVEIGRTNRAFAKRLRAAAEKDANVNALTVLDTFAKVMPDSIDGRLDELRYLFTSWKETPKPTAG